MPLNDIDLTNANTIAQWLQVTNDIVDFLKGNTAFGNTIINGTFSANGASSANGTLTITGGDLNVGKLVANSSVISANTHAGLTGTFLANGVANTVTVTNGIITSVT